MTIILPLMKFHRISDVGHSLRELNRSINFEARFTLEDDTALIMHGRIVDFEGREIFSSCDARDIALDKYKSWDPRKELRELIETMNSEGFIEERMMFAAPLLEINFQIDGTGPYQNTYRVIVNMSYGFKVLEEYKWNNSGCLSVSMFIDKQELLVFLRCLSSDLDSLFLDLGDRL